MSQMYPAVSQEKQTTTLPDKTSSEHNLVVRNKTCNSKKELQVHYAEPTRRKEYVCNVCQKRLTRKNNLQIHYLIHTGEKPHVCDICNSCFADKNYLRKHKLIHTVDKPHVCDICNRDFTEKRKLRKHKLTHIGQKSHDCDICKQVFTKNRQLKRHYVTHSSEKIHICKICNKGYVRKHHLNNHYLLHSRDQEKKNLKPIGKKVEKGKKEVIFQISKYGHDLEKLSVETTEVVEQQEIEKGRVPIFQATSREHVDVTSADCNGSQDPILLQSESQVCLVSAQAITTNNQKTTHIIHEPLNICPQRIQPPMNKDQQEIAQLDQQVSSQISHLTLSQIGHIIHQALATILAD